MRFCSSNVPNVLSTAMLFLFLFSFRPVLVECGRSKCLSLSLSLSLSLTLTDSKRKKAFSQVHFTHSVDRKLLQLLTLAGLSCTWVKFSSFLLSTYSLSLSLSLSFSESMWKRNSPQVRLTPVSELDEKREYRDLSGWNCDDREEEGTGRG